MKTNTYRVQDIDRCCVCKYERIDGGYDGYWCFCIHPSLFKPGEAQITKWENIVSDMGICDYFERNN